MPKILVAGSLNMDMTVRLGQFPQAGQTVLGRGFAQAAGGKGANQAVQLARLGSEVTMVGKVGDDDSGRALVEVCKAEKIDTTHISVDPTYPTGTAVILVEEKEGQDAQNRIVVVPGANMVISEEDIAWLEEGIADFDMVLLQMEIPVAINMCIARWAKAKGVPVMLNPAPAAPLPAELLQNITILSPNETEAEALSGVTIHTYGDLPDIGSTRVAAGQILNQGVPEVLITLGEAGAGYFRGRSMIYQSSYNVRAVDPTAAGDSFVAAFCHARCLGMEIEDTMTFAAKAASITVSRRGAIPALPTREEVK